MLALKTKIYSNNILLTTLIVYLSLLWENYVSISLNSESLIKPFLLN